MARYERGDYVKVEFPDDTTGIGEWMWVLDNDPLKEYGGKVKLGSVLAVSYDKVREHTKASEFKKR